MSLEDNMVICHRKGYKGLGISLNHSLREYFRERLRELDMGLENRLKDNVDQFSGGQRQALTLLMAVLSEPAILLLDEHTAALDPRNAEIVMGLTRSFRRTVWPDGHDDHAQYESRDRVRQPASHDGLGGNCP